MPSRQILTVEQMRAAEQALIDAGESVESLMERAGAGAADYVFRMAAGRPVTVLCGPGNNGGDGYVIARALGERGVPVQVVAPLGPTTEAAKTARAKWGGVPVDDAPGNIKGHVFVDCLFGSGLTRGLSPELAALLARLASQHDLRVAVDLPSGVESDSGALLNRDLPEYHLVIALGAWKYAHWTMPGMALMRERRLFDIGVAEVRGAAQLAERPNLSAPAMDAHKYTRGLVAVVGGAMPGAARLAARAAQHGGAGYVKLLAEDSAPVPDDIVLETASLEQGIADPRLAALLVGPGLGRGQHACLRLITAINFERTLVLDGDALMLLEPEMLAGRTADLVLTPHEGELRRLCQTFSIPAGPKRERALALAAATRATVVAKGPDTVIVDPFEGMVIAPPAPSWLSAAGTGDVLAGLITSRLATGGGLLMAAVEGCALHAEAARIAGSAFSASDLIAAIPAAYASFL